MIQDAFWGILIPFLGTSLGAGCVFFLKNALRDGIQRALTGFAAGVMVRRWKTDQLCMGDHRRRTGGN